MTILTGRPELGYFEAGLDMGWTFDPYESFRMFQGKVFDVYEELIDKEGLTVIDAEGAIPDQQQIVRKHITSAIDLADFKRPYMPRLPMEVALDEDDAHDASADH